MTNYYDPIYGQINLDSQIVEMVTRCPELKRLRYIGMMNFKSLSMLPLTNISRLEHSIGLAYLAQIFLNTNRLSLNLHQDLIVAALYHDVNCGPFGHSVEWAINRHIPYKHESDVEWVKTEDVLSCLIDKPIFLEQDGLHQHGFVDKFKLNLERIDKIISGDGYYYINNKGIDLDNIDNVFRMAHYMGFPCEPEMPLRVVRALRTSSDLDNFIIKKSDLFLVEEWLKQRSSVYERFIYDDEYMGYEYLLFELVSEYASCLNSIADLKNIFHYTDERLLWLCYDMKSSNPRVAKISKRLLLHDIPYCYGILVSDSLPIQNPLSDREVRARLVSLFESEMSQKGINAQLYLHMTTDNRKTNRQIDIYVDEDSGQKLTSIGNDKEYVVLAILGERDISSVVTSKIINIATEILEKEGFINFTVYKSNRLHSRQISLF